MLALHCCSPPKTSRTSRRRTRSFPEGKEIFWAVICFVIVFALLAWKAWPAIKKALKDREDKIRGDLERAEQARIEAETSLEEYQQQLAEARNEAGEDHRGGPARGRAGAPGAHRRDRRRDRRASGPAPQEDIRLATERAMAELQGRVAELSIELAEKVVERNLDRDTQIRLIENYINQVGSN